MKKLCVYEIVISTAFEKMGKLEWQKMFDFSRFKLRVQPRTPYSQWKINAYTV